MTNPILEAALKYHAMGFSIIPIKPDYDLEKMKALKSPYGDWIEYQTKQPTQDKIREWWGQHPKAMIGIVTGPVSNLCVVDLDKYKPEYSEEVANQYFPDSIITPTANTPQGGQHLFFAWPGDERLTVDVGTVPGIDFRGKGGYIVAPPSIDLLNKKYAWLEGLDIFTTPLSSLPCIYIKTIITNARARVAKGMPGGNGDGLSRQMSSMSSSVDNIYREGRRDNDLFHIANLLVKSGCEDGYLYKTLDILAKNCDPPFSSFETEQKIKSALERANRKERNLSEEIREYVLSSNGVFLSSDVVKCLHLSSREDEKHLSKVLERLRKEGLIEKNGNKRGQFRVLDRDEEIIDYQSASVEPYGLKMPLGIHEFVSIHPGNVIVIAGESNAGKSAFCLNVARMNCNLHPVKYLSSEMQDGAELKIRLQKFGESLDVWEPIKFVFRTDNFTDSIDQDGLNIIDYLDEGTDAEAYKMPMRIRNIADRLKKGVCLIALQKDPNKGLGFGGSGTLNRSRLYLTMTRQGVLKIEKAKIWRNEGINPNGMFCNFKLVAGAKFTKDGDWKV